MFWYVVAILIIIYAYKRYSKKRLNLISQFPDLLKKNNFALSDDEASALKIHKENILQFILVFAASLGVAIWFGTYQPMQIQKDLDLQSQTYGSKLSEGWRYQCEDMFKNFIGNGTFLYANGNSYDQTWCNSLLTDSILDAMRTNEELFTPSEYSDVESAGEKGLNIGARFAREAVFSRVPYLCYGPDCITLTSIEDYYLEQNLNDYYP